jgi:hypothetical protein
MQLGMEGISAEQYAKQLIIDYALNKLIEE